jgi:hypothetical protein
MEDIGERISPYLIHLTRMSMKDMSGLVRDAGMDDNEVDNLIQGALRELEQHDRCALCKLYCIYATKP